MRYFTRGWVNGEYSEEDFEAADLQYQARLAATRSTMSAAVVALTETNLHDGVIEHIVWDERIRRLSLFLVIGDLQRGYAGLSLTYERAMLGEERLQTLRELGVDRRAELLCDEVDVNGDGTFQHRMIFWPTHELTVDFVSLALEIDERSDRRVEPGGAFSEVDHGD
jgi:hypothetical protein